MNFNARVYQDVVLIDGMKYEAQYNMSTGQLLVPYTETPDIGKDDVIVREVGKRNVSLKVLDAQLIREGTLKRGTKHPHLLKLKVEDMTSQKHETDAANNTIFNIGSITSEQLQVGNHNAQSITINVQKLVEEVAQSDDPKAKGLLLKLLENSTVSSIIGSGVSALIGTLAQGG